MDDRNKRAAEAYVTDSIFPSGYVRQLQPALLSYVAATSGYPPPDPMGPFIYMELGCGNGATLNVLAAANPESQFLGVDLNPAHIDHARNDAHRANLANVSYIEGSFDDIKRDDLPECDFIVTHGAYSWLPPSALAGVHDIVREKLRAGGLFFVDYLCAPGRVPIDPIWTFLRETTRHIDGTSEDRVARGMEILKQLGASDLGYLANTPAAKAVLARDLRRIDAGRPNILSQLAHHALAEHQKPLYFFEIQEELALCGLQFAGSTSTLRNDPGLCLPAEFEELYSSQEDSGVRELIKDFLLNEIQRKDVYVKADGADEAAAREYLRSKVYIFSMRRAAVILKNWKHQYQNWKIRHKPDDAIEVLLDCIGNGTNGFGEIELIAKERGNIEFEQLVRGLNLLLARPNIHLCRKAPLIRAAGQFALSAPDRTAMGGADMARRSRMVVASPVLGGGLVLGPGSAGAIDTEPNGDADSSSSDLDVSSDEQGEDSDRKRISQIRLMAKLAQLEILE